MIKSDIEMYNSNMFSEKDVGFRFHLFRKAIGKTEKQLALELNTSEEEIHKIESGAALPQIKHLYFLSNKYQLNINWLLVKDGLMFHEGEPGKTKEKTDPLLKKFMELISFVQVPEIEKHIDAALVEIRALIELEKTRSLEKEED